MSTLANISLEAGNICLDYICMDLYVQLLSDSAGYAFIGIGIDGNLTHWNKGAEAMYGRDSEEALGQPYSILYPANSTDQCIPESLLERALTYGKCVGNRVHCRKSGYVFSVEFVMALMYDPNGEAKGFLLITHDLSENKNKDVITTKVLHNVGNVLNSVNVSFSMMEAAVKKMSVDKLTDVAALLSDHAVDLNRYITQDSKGKLIPDFLHQLSNEFTQCQQDMLQEMADMRVNIDHLKKIVSTQQNFCRERNEPEIIDLAGLVDLTISINQGYLDQHHVTVIREYTDTLQVCVDVHELTQILVNLILNAVQACSASGHAEHQIKLGLRSAGGSAILTVSDNGVGIEPEKLSLIFTYGYTTRDEGHGHGLYSAAIDAKEMGGTLSVESGGVGKGATFTLEIPMHSTKTQTASDSPKRLVI